MADETDKVEPSAPTCLADPNFAVICSFMDKFAVSIGITVLPFTQLQEMLEDQDQVSQALIDLHVKLLRKARKSFTVDKWEKALTKFAHTYAQQDGWELERFGYKKASLGVKLRLLKTLLEAQFDVNVRFKNEVNKLGPDELRIEPLGKDGEGLTYWCQFDPACNVRVYREDVDEETWDLVAQDRNGLVKLIDSLSAGEGQQELSLIMEEEANQESEKPVTDTGQGEDDVGEEVDSEEIDEEEDAEAQSGEQNLEGSESDDMEDSESLKGEESIDKPSKDPVEKEDLKKQEITDEEMEEAHPNGGIEADVAHLQEKAAHLPAETTVPKKTAPSKEPESCAASKPEAKYVEDAPVRSADKEKKEIASCVPLNIPARPQLTKPGQRPGSKLEEIFKMKLDRPAYAYPDDKTSILSQMAARFNNDTEVEDLSTSRKKPRLENVVSKLTDASALKSDPVVGEAIEEKVMVVQGEGSGAECNAGNPLAEPEPDSTMEVIGVFNGSSETSVREALRHCILDDSLTKASPQEKTPSRDDLSGELGAVEAQLGLLEQIRLIGRNANLKPKTQVSVDTVQKDFVFEASEAIEEEVMYFTGCGAGHECDTGNSNEPAAEPSTSVEPDKKPTKKLWSIDTICKTSDENKTVDEEETQSNGREGEKTEENLEVGPSEKSDSVENGRKEGEPDKEKGTGEKTVMLTNLIEHCLFKNNSAGEENSTGKGPPSGTSYQDLFSAKNIDGPSIVKRDLSGEKSEEIVSKKSGKCDDAKLETSSKQEKVASKSEVEKVDAADGASAVVMSDKKPIESFSETSKDSARGASAVVMSDKKSVESSSEKSKDSAKGASAVVMSDKKPIESSSEKSKDSAKGASAVVKSDEKDVLSSSEKSKGSAKGASAVAMSDKKPVESSSEKSKDSAKGSSAVAMSDKKSAESANENNKDSAKGTSAVVKPEEMVVESSSEKSKDSAKEPSAPALGKTHDCPDVTKSNEPATNTVLNQANEEPRDATEGTTAAESPKMACTEKVSDVKKISLQEQVSTSEKSNETENVPIRNTERTPNEIEADGIEITGKKLGEARTVEGSKEKVSVDSEKPDEVSKEPDVLNSDVGPKAVDKLSSRVEVDQQPTNKSLEETGLAKVPENTGKESSLKEPNQKRGLKAREDAKISDDPPKEPDKKSNKEKSSTKKPDFSGKSSGKLYGNSVVSEGEPSGTDEAASTQKTDEKPRTDMPSKESEVGSTSNHDGAEKEPAKEHREPDLKVPGKPGKGFEKKIENTTKPERKLKANDPGDDTPHSGNESSPVESKVEPSEVKAEKELSKETSLDALEKKDTDKGSDVKIVPSTEEVKVENELEAKGEGEKPPGDSKTVKKEDIEEVVKAENKIELDNKSGIDPVKTESAPIADDAVETTNNKPKGRKSRTNSLNVEEVPSKVRKTDEDQTIESSGRRASRRTRNASVKISEETKKLPKGKSGQPSVEVKEEKTLTLSAFSLEEPLDDLMPKVAPSKPKCESATKGGKRKRGATSSVKSEEDGTEEEDSKAEEVEEVGGKKPRLRAKKGGKRQRGKPGPKPSKETAEVEADDATQTKTAVKTEKPADEDEDDVPLAKRGRPRNKQRTLLGLTDSDIKPIITPEGGGRASRRIAMQKIKEEAERRAVEEALKDIDNGDKKKKKKKNSDKCFKVTKDVGGRKKDQLDKTKDKGKNRKKQKPETDEEDEGEADDDKKKRKRKNRGFKYNINRPWASSSGSSDENVEEEEEDHLDFMGLDDEEDVRGNLVSDHEFSCDEDLGKGEGEAEPVRRARTAIRKDKSEEPSKGAEEVAEEEDATEDYKCEKCGSGDHPEWILLCDTCDKGYHASCLRPPLMLIPEGDWHCPPCQHANLVKKLKGVLRTFEKNTKRRDNEELRRKRLAYVGISLANVLPDSAGSKVKKEKRPRESESEEDSEAQSGSSSAGSDTGSTNDDSNDEPVYQLRQRRSAAQNYRFNEYDQLIDSAIQDEMVAAGGTAPQGTGVAAPASAAAPEGPEGVPEVPAENGLVAENEALGEPLASVGDGEDVSKGENEGDEEEEGDISKGWRPPVVPRKPTVAFSGRKKPKKLCNLDVESDDQNDSDEDFKGSSSDDEEDDFSGGSDESGNWSRRRQPLRRSGRARQSRVDRDFINDDSEDSSGPRTKKKKRQEWEESDSTSSDRSWGRRKKRSTARSSFSKSNKSKSRKSTKYHDSDSDAPKKKPKTKKPKARVRYGLSEEDDDDGPLIKTRGKKMNYTEIHGSDTEEEERINRIKGRKTLSDMEAEDEEFVLDKEEEEEFMGGKSLVRKAPRRISSGSDHTDDEKPEENAASKEDAEDEPEKEETDKPETDKSKSAPSRPMPPASQPLPASRPKPCPLSKKPRNFVESDDEQFEEAACEEEELADEEEPPEDEESEEDDEIEEKEPPRRIPPPVPSLKALVPGQPPPDLAKSGTLSKLKEALSAGERKPKESEALARLREKLANAAARPNNAGPAPPSQPDTETQKEKPPSPPPSQPVINSIRVVNTAKLLAQPVQEALKRQEESAMRGMMVGHSLPHGPPSMYPRMYPPRRMMTPAMDPRFMQRPPFLPSTHPMHHQQRRFPDRYMYGPSGPGGPGSGFHGGYFPPAPGPPLYPPQEIRPVPASDFADGPLPPADDDPPPFAGSAPPKTEGPGEFGGLVSYFSSQREEEADLET